jgi:RHS repeat-associated protein
MPSHNTNQQHGFLRGRGTRSGSRALRARSVQVGLGVVAAVTMAMVFAVGAGAFSDGSAHASQRVAPSLSAPPFGFLRPPFNRSRRLQGTVTGTITPGGSPVSVTINAGDHVELSFSGAAGERVAVSATNVAMSGYQYGFDVAQLEVLKPDGSPLSGLSGNYAVVDASSGGFLDTVTLPTTDTYRVAFLPPDAGTNGSVSLTLYDVPADPAPVVTPSSGAGTSVTLSTTTPGQNMGPTFTGTQGQRVSVRVTNPTITGYQFAFAAAQIKVLQGDESGPALYGLGGNYAFVDASTGGFFDTVTLPANGLYTVFVDLPGPATGGATITVYNVPPDPTAALAVGGASAALGATTTLGQNIGPTFSGRAGQPVTVTVSNVAMSGYQFGFAAAQLTVVRLVPGQNGVQVGNPVFVDASTGGALTVTLPQDATYTAFVDLQGVATGSATVTVARSVPFESPTQTTGTCGERGVHALAVSECLADPVNSLTGAFTDSETDLSLAAMGIAFTFTRSYTSADSTVGRLGPGWTDNYAVSLALQPNGDVLLHGDEGQQVFYTKQADGSFVGAGGALSTLSTNAGGYKLLRHDQVSYQFDANGVLQSELDRNGQGLSFAYDGSGRLTTITDAAAHVVTVGYNASNLVSSVSTPDGRAVSYVYTGGRLTSVTLPDPDGPGGPLASPVWTYTYNADGRLWQEIDPNSHTQITNVYDPTTGRVSEQTDANQKMTTFAWDAGTQTATITDANQHVWKDIYQNNVLIEQIDPAGDVTQFGHNVALDTTGVTSPNGTDTTSMNYQDGNVVTAIAPASLGGVQKTFTYDSQNNVRTVTDARTKLTQYGYDAGGNNNSIILDGQQVFGATYNAQGQMLTSTDGNGKQSTYTYDPSGNLASVTTPDPDGAGPLAASKTTYTYDAMGNVLTKISPLGNCSGCVPSNYTTTYTYDTNSRLLTETDPLGHTATYTYDAAGNRTSLKDANNHTTTYSYDNANRLRQITGADPDGGGPLEAPVTTYTYDDAGNRLTMVEPRGNCSGCTPATYTTTYTYDQNNMLASVTTPKGEKTTYTYDATGNLASTVDPRGNVQGANPDDYKTTYTYDAAGRLLTTTDPLGHVTTNHYDSIGNLDWAKDANLHQTSYTYDAAGRTLTIIAPDNGLTTYTYDADGNLKTSKDDNNHLTTYTYDNAGRRTQITGTDPDGVGPLTAPLTTYTYDASDNLTATTDPNGNATQTVGDGTTSYGYDHTNRLISTSYSDATPAVGYAYDNVGNRTSMTDGSGSVSYVYDNLNRLTSVTRGSNTFSYVYDPAGNVTSRTYPDGTQIGYSYDEDNRLAGAATSGTTTGYSYDPASELTQTTLPAANGYLETRTYDRAGRLTEVKNAKGASVLSDYVSTLDPVGNPTQTVQSGAVAATQNFTYDANDRLLSVCFQAGNCPGSTDPFIRWGYDKVGNRLTESRPATATTYTYNAADELSQTSAQNLGPNLYSGQVQTDSAQPYWRLGEASGTTFASTVGTFNGTWSGGPTLGVVGALTGDTNTAATLSGATQFGTVANSSQLNKTNNFSLELWLKRTKNASLQAVAGKPLTTTTKSENYAIWIDTSNQARFEVGTGTKSATVTCTAHPLDTNWHHLTGTFASGSLKIYYDGTLCNTATGTFTSAGTNTSSFNVGVSGANNYNGSLDEMAVYGVALTAAQIIDHYSKGIKAPTAVSYAYDSDGNETSAGAATISYDLANRIKTYTSGATTTTYSYDGDNNRLLASTGTSASQKTNYLWDTNRPLTQLALERDGNNVLLRRYVYGSRRISMATSANSYYYHYDALGSVANLSNSVGVTEWTDSYEPYGVIHSETQNDPSAPTNLMKFAGEYTDPTGLYHLGARQYDPVLGRFGQVDPVPARAGQAAVGPYVYVADRPTVMVDPSGMTRKLARVSLDAATVASSADDGFLGILDDWWRAPSRLSANGFNFLLQHEGNRGLYNDSQNNCTFGIGHLVHLGPCTRADHAKYDGYTLRQRFALARSDIARYEGAVHSRVHVPVTQYQFDALVSFTFNIGIQAFSTCTALRRMNAGEYRDVPDAMLLFRFPPEIRGRRCDEARLFATGRYTDRGC